MLHDAGAGEDLTRTGMYVMTPEFAAPEQARGEAVSTVTDVYALGVLLYILLTGTRPYDVRGRSPAEIERIICDTEPPKPSLTFDAASADSDASERARARYSVPDRMRRLLRGDLDAIVLTALHQEPARRYSSVAALQGDVERLRAGLPIHARPAGAAYRLGKFVRRHRTVVVASAITLTALVSATAFRPHRCVRRRCSGMLRSGCSAAACAVGRADGAGGTSHGSPMNCLLRSVSASAMRSSPHRARLAMLEDSLRVLRGDRPAPPPVLAMPFVTTAAWRLAAGDARAADSLALLGRAAAAVDSLALQRSAYAGRAELVRARALLTLGDRAAARQAAERAIVALATGYGPSSPHTARARELRDSIQP